MVTVVEGVDVENLDPRIMPALKKIEWELWGDEPGFLTITSGYRSPEYNAKIGGAKYSKHIEGIAVDLSTYGFSIEVIRELLMRLSLEGFNGLGFYKNNSLHADLRETKACWGPDYTRNSIPEEVADIFEAHLEGRISI